MARLKLKAWGEEHEIILSIEHYADNNNLAIQMWHIEDGVLLPWSILTVNTDKRCKPNCAFIDTNNNGDHMIEWLEKYNLGMQTGNFNVSGYCIYPEFEFDMDEVMKYTLASEMTIIYNGEEI